MWLSSLYQMAANLPRRIRAARMLRQWIGRAPAPPAGGDAGPAPNPLRDYLAHREAGPGIQKWLHYPEIYHAHLAKFVGRGPVVVEVGVESGGSLRMWLGYFGPGCQVHGIDVDPGCASLCGTDITVHVGDQQDRAMWEQFRSAVPQVDVLIDDGGHRPEQQIVTLEEMLPHLRPGGVYICEDVHGIDNRFSEFVYALCNGLNAGEIDKYAGIDGIATTAFQSAIHSIHFYPFLVLIEKRESAAPLFSAPVRGMQRPS